MERDPIFGMYWIPSHTERRGLDRRLIEVSESCRDKKGAQFLKLRKEGQSPGFYPHFIENISPPFPGYHGHDFFEIAIAVQGTAEYRTEKSTLSISQGDMLFVNPGIFHRYRKKTAIFSLLNLCFDPGLIVPGFRSEIIGPFASSIPFLEPFFRCDSHFDGRLTLSKSDFKKYLHLALSLVEDFGQGEKGTVSSRAGFRYFFEKTLSLFRQRVAGASHSIPIVGRVAAYVQAQRIPSLSLRDLAQKMEVDPYYLGKKFKKETGSSLGDYFHRCRLRWVLEQCVLLGKPNWKDLAHDAGFGSLSRFYSFFSKEMGMSPSNYWRSKASSK